MGIRRTTFLIDEHIQRGGSVTNIHNWLNLGDQLWSLHFDQNVNHIWPTTSIFGISTSSFILQGFNRRSRSLSISSSPEMNWWSQPQNWRPQVDNISDIWVYVFVVYRCVVPMAAFLDQTDPKNPKRQDTFRWCDMNATGSDARCMNQAELNILKHYSNEFEGTYAFPHIFGVLVFDCTAVYSSLLPRASRRPSHTTYSHTTHIPSGNLT